MGGSSPPIGLPLLANAGIFGVGTQITHGIGCATLVAARQRLHRMWMAQPIVCLRGVLGGQLAGGAPRVTSAAAQAYG